jgi:hypothetical protein
MMNKQIPMKYTRQTSLLFAFFASAVYAGEKQSAIWPSPPNVEHNDPAWGVFVTVTKHNDKNPECSSYSHSSGTEEIDGVKYSVSTSRSDESTETFRVRLTEPTLRHLITDRTEHDFLRFIAIRDLPDAKLDKDTTIELLSTAAREPKALLRSMAVKKISSIKPRKDIVHLLVELLKDPCASVAHDTLFPLIDFYDLKEASGEKPALTTFWRSRATGFYHCQQQEILRVAELIHARNAALVSALDLEAIRAREVPSVEWYLNLGWDKADVPRAQSHFREQYFPDKGTGTSAPAAVPYSKSESGNKPRTESEGRAR